MSRSLILDTNLSVLLIAGMADKNIISRHKRLNMFDEIDFDLLTEMISKFDVIIINTNVLSETSNLIRHIGEPFKSLLMRKMKYIVDNYDEKYVPSRNAVVRPEYVRLGLTDSVLLELGNSGVSLLTVDFDLYSSALSAGYSVANFNHIRDQRADFH